jgi:hypothetical protein
MTQNTDNKNKDGRRDGGRRDGKRKGVWSEVQTFEESESGLAVIITERVRGAPAYSFQIVAIDKRGVNKFIQVPCNGTVDVEHVVFSLAKRAHEFIAEKMAEDVARTQAKKDRDKKSRGTDGDKKDDKPKKTRRGGRGKGGGGDKKPRGGLSTLAKQDAAAGGHDYVGPTRRDRDKKSGKAGAKA